MLCRIMRKLFSTSRWLLSRAGLMDIFRWAPCITVSLLTLCLNNYYQYSEDQNTLKPPTTPFFRSLWKLVREKKSPHMWLEGLDRDLNLLECYMFYPRNLRGKWETTHILLKPTNTDIFPRSFPLGQFTPDCLGVASGKEWGEVAVFADCNHWPAAVVH